MDWVASLLGRMHFHSKAGNPGQILSLAGNEMYWVMVGNSIDKKSLVGGMGLMETLE